MEFSKVFKIACKLLCCGLIAFTLFSNPAAVNAEDDRFYVDGRPELCDGSYYTNGQIDSETKLTISNHGKTFAGIYFIYDEIPEEVTIEYNGKSKTVTDIKYMHDLVELDEEVTEAVVSFPDGALINDIFPGGESSQRWETLDDADLLVVSTHADDEWLWLGGTIPFYVNEGMKVQVAYTVNHALDAGHGHEYFRTHELLDALYHSKVKYYPIISDFADEFFTTVEDAEGFYGKDSFTYFVTDVIRRVKPEVVVTQSLDGEYGHGAHILTSRSVTEAVKLASDNDYNDGYDTHAVSKLYLHLYDKSVVNMDWNRRLSLFDDQSAYDIAEQSFLFNVSQTDGWAMHRYDEYDNARFGLYFTTVGKDYGKYDFFENVPGYGRISKKKIAIYSVPPVLICGAFGAYFVLRKKKKDEN